MASITTVNDPRGMDTTTIYGRPKDTQQYIYEMYYHPLGYFLERDGIKNLADTAVNANAGTIYELVWDGYTSNLFMQVGTTWQISSAGLGASWASIATGLTANHVSMSMFRISGTLNAIFCNGAEVPKKYPSAGAVATLLGSWGVAKFVHTHSRKLWFFGIQTAGEKMYARFSATDNAEDSTTANDAGYLDLGAVLPTADDPMGMATYGDDIVFFFRNYTVIYAAKTDPREFYLKRVLHIGLSSERGYCELEGDIVMMTQEGIRPISVFVSGGVIGAQSVKQGIDGYYQSNFLNQSDALLNYSRIINVKNLKLLLITPVGYVGASTIEQPILVGSYARIHEVGIIWSVWRNNSDINIFDMCYSTVNKLIFASTYNTTTSFGSCAKVNNGNVDGTNDAFSSAFALNWSEFDSHDEKRLVEYSFFIDNNGGMALDELLCKINSTSETLQNTKTLTATGPNMVRVQVGRNFDRVFTQVGRDTVGTTRLKVYGYSVTIEYLNTNQRIIP